MHNLLQLTPSACVVQTIPKVRIRKFSPLVSTISRQGVVLVGSTVFRIVLVAAGCSSPFGSPCRRQPVRSGQVRLRGSIDSGAAVAPASPAGKVGVTVCQGHFEGGSGSCDTWTCHRTCHRRFPCVGRGGVYGSHRSPPTGPVTVDLSQKSPHRWRALII